MRIAFYDQHCGWGPGQNASKGTGGSEIHLTQLATWLASHGHDVIVQCHDAKGVEAGVLYEESRGAPPGHDVDAVVSVRRSRIPEHIRAKRWLSLCTDDPANPEPWAHLLGRSTTLVCVSEWQGRRYRELGHRVAVIPAMIDDATYDSIINDPSGALCCVSAWNKGTQETLDAWPAIRNETGGTFSVGWPYSAPGDAKERVEAAGAICLGELRPSQIVDVLSTHEAHVRVCTIGETFGATDAIARAVGARVHVLCTGEVGALRETVPGSVYTDRGEWLVSLAQRRQGQPSRDFRVSSVAPAWLPLLEGRTEGTLL